MLGLNFNFLPVENFGSSIDWVGSEFFLRGFHAWAGCNIPFAYLIKSNPFSQRKKKKSLSPLLSSPPPSLLSLARSLGRLLSKRRRQGSGAALASSSSDASPADKVCPHFPFPSFPAVRNRTPKPPIVCYLYSDLTMDFTCELQFFCP
jgi:hypothetical protein